MCPDQWVAGRMDAADQELLGRAARANQGPDRTEFSTAALASLAREEGLDFATAALYDLVSRRPETVEFRSQLRGALGRSRGKSTILIGIIPGAFHREHKRTGADGRRVVELFRRAGFRAETVPLASFASLRENSRAIVDWLEQRGEERVLLVSLSKGSADLKIALSLPEAKEAWRRVGGWVSLSGLAQGTPLVGWLRTRRLHWFGVQLLFWWRGYRRSVLEELDHGAGTPLAGWPRVPPHWRVAHVCGFPLRRHLKHPWALRGYERVASLGPNDGGGILLGDTLTWPGAIVPIWGVDHYLQPDWDCEPLLGNILTAAADSMQA